VLEAAVDLLALRGYALRASSAAAWLVVVSVSSTAGHSRAHGHAESSDLGRSGEADPQTSAAIPAE
jgi:hypothetical protein